MVEIRGHMVQIYQKYTFKIILGWNIPSLFPKKFPKRNMCSVSMWENVLKTADNRMYLRRIVKRDCTARLDRLKVVARDISISAFGPLIPFLKYY